MSDYLSGPELAELVGCKPNQRSRMISWLEQNRWRYVLDINGLPKVARAYHDRKLGVSEQIYKAKYEEAPNRNAFA